MDNLSHIIDLISLNDYLVSLDLSDASIAMHFQLMPYHAFFLAEICHQFACLAHGLYSEPCNFPCYEKITAWIDDFISRSSVALVSFDVSLCHHTFGELSFIPKFERSHFQPV